MRQIDIAISNDGTTSPGSIALGHVGEHNVVQLHFKISIALEQELSFFRVSAGEFLSDQIQSVAGDMYFTVPAAMLSAETVFLQLNGYKMDSNDLPSAVFKSDIILGYVHESLNSSTELPTDVNASLETLEVKTKRLIDDLIYNNQIANLTYSNLGFQINEAKQMMDKYVYYVSEKEVETLAAPTRAGVLLFEFENNTNDLKNVYISYSDTPDETGDASNSATGGSSSDTSNTDSGSSDTSGSDTGSSDSETMPTYRWLKLWGKSSYIDRDNLSEYAETKTEVVEMTDRQTLTLQSNRVYLYGESLNIYPEFNVPEDERNSFYCELRFTSGETPTAFYSLNAYYTGAECSGGSFVPMPKKRYNICYWFDGCYQAAVRSCPTYALSKGTVTI